MFKIKLVITIIATVFLVTQSNLFSQEKAITGSNENTIINAGKDQNPHTGIFKLHNSRQTQFENTTVIQFELGEEADVLLTVYDSKGILVETLIDDLMDSGVYNIHFKSEKKIISGELTYKLEVKGISGIKNIFAVK